MHLLLELNILKDSIKKIYIDSSTYEIRKLYEYKDDLIVIKREDHFEERKMICSLIVKYEYKENLISKIYLKIESDKEQLQEKEEYIVNYNYLFWEL